MYVEQKKYMKTILEHMKAEHKEVVTLYQDFLLAKNHKESVRLFEKFRINLISHLKLEEESLSPAFNKRLGLDEETSQITNVLKHDHFEIIKLLNALNLAINSESAEDIEYIKNHFIRALEKHHKREEELQYDVFNTIFSKEEWGQILKNKQH
jgi:hemerythrin